MTGTRRSRAWWPALAALAMCTAAPGATRAQTPDGLEPGERPAPATVQDLEGNPVPLADVVGGRPALVEFWAVWCGNCLALHPQLLEAHRRYGDRVGFVAVAVAVGQTTAEVRRWLEERPVPFPTLWDARGEAVRAFRAPATSYIVILDAEGRVAYAGVGSEQDLLGALEEVVGPAGAG